MANSILKTKKSTAAAQKRLLAKFNIDEMDMAFCDLQIMGWSETLAAYYAYGLTSEIDATIMNYIRNIKNHHPGINEYLHYLNEVKQEGERDVQREKIRLERERADVANLRREDCEYDLTSKQGMLDYLINLSKTPGLDLRTKADLAKQITDLQNYKKEDVKIEDNRINFYLPITCRYCSKCNSCQIREWADNNGCKSLIKPDGMPSIKE